MSTFDLTVAFAVVAMMPLVIWSNYRNREGGLMGYLWRENPALVWSGLLMLSLVTLFSAGQLLAHFGFVGVDAEETISLLLGIPMGLLSLAIIALAAVEAVRRPPA